MPLVTLLISLSLQKVKRMFSTLKGYLIAGAGVVVALFLAVFSYRGKKIESLEKDVETERDNVKEVEAAIEKVKKVQEMQDRYDEINANIHSSSSDDNRKRLSKFYRD